MYATCMHVLRLILEFTKLGDYQLMLPFYCNLDKNHLLTKTAGEHLVPKLLWTIPDPHVHN